MEDELADDHGENGAAPEPERSFDEVEPELLATFTEIGIVETRRAIEAILLVATDPTPATLLAQLLEVPVEHVELLCHALADSYEEANHGFQLVKVAGGWRFQTHPDMAPYVERFAMDGQSTKLSNAALETLAIVAYKQPISRAQVSAIRGVNVDAVLRTLVQRGYVDEVGRDTGAGQAVLFGTTSMFLERLGINTVSDLPALGDFVPSAEVVEALEQTLKVDLDPDLRSTDIDGDSSPARPPAPPEAAEPEAGPDAPPEGAEVEPEPTEPAEPADEADGAEVEAEAAEELSPEAEPAVEEAAAESELAVEEPPTEQPAAEADPAAEPSEVEPEPAAEPKTEDGEQPPVAEAVTEEPAAVAADDVVVDEAAPVLAAQPGNERAADQTGASSTATSEAAVVAPEGVVVDAQASPKSGAYRVEPPVGPGGQPAGLQAGGGEPGLADPAPATVAGTGAGVTAGVDWLHAGPDDGHPGGPDPAGRPAGADARDRSGQTAGADGAERPGHASGRPDPSARTGAEPGDPGAAAGRADNPVPAGRQPDGGHAGEADRPAGAPTPAPTFGGQPAPQPDAAPAGSGDPVAGPGPRFDGPTGDPGGPAGSAHDPAGHHPPERGTTAGPGGPGLVGPADPAVPSVAGPGPELTAPPEVDLRPAIDLTDPPEHAPAPSPAVGTGAMPVEPDRPAGS